MSQQTAAPGKITEMHGGPDSWVWRKSVFRSAAVENAEDYGGSSQKLAAAGTAGKFPRGRKPGIR